MASRISQHARQRSRQRGISEAQISTVLRYADRVAHRGNNAEYVWISNRRLNDLTPTTPEGMDAGRLKNVHVLVAADGTIMTVVRTRKRVCRWDV